MDAFDLIKNFQSGKFGALTIVRGEDPYIFSELRTALNQFKVEVHRAVIKGDGPPAEIEDLSRGGSLFTTRSFVWISQSTAPSKWSKKACDRWDGIVSRADGEELSIFFQIGTDKRIKWDALGAKPNCDISNIEEQKPKWLQYMAAKEDFKLDREKLQFLLSFDEDLLTYSNWIALWKLGGDLWAERSLSWGLGGSGKDALNLGRQNPAFAWVDALLNGDRKRSLAVLELLMSDGAEPLQLLALLSKSLRLLALLEAGAVIPKSYPPFLVQKLKPLVSRSRGRGQALLARSAEMDRLMKSAPVDSKRLMSFVGEARSFN